MPKPTMTISPRTTTAGSTGVFDAFMDMAGDKRDAGLPMLAAARASATDAEAIAWAAGIATKDPMTQGFRDLVVALPGSDVRDDEAVFAAISETIDRRRGARNGTWPTVLTSLLTGMKPRIEEITGIGGILGSRNTLVMARATRGDPDAHARLYAGHGWTIRDVFDASVVAAGVAGFAKDDVILHRLEKAGDTAPWMPGSASPETLRSWIADECHKPNGGRPIRAFLSPLAAARAAVPDAVFAGWIREGIDTVTHLPSVPAMDTLHAMAAIIPDEGRDDEAIIGAFGDLVTAIRGSAGRQVPAPPGCFGGSYVHPLRPDDKLPDPDLIMAMRNDDRAWDALPATDIIRDAVRPYYDRFPLGTVESLERESGRFGSVPTDAIPLVTARIAAAFDARITGRGMRQNELASLRGWNSILRGNTTDVTGEDPVVVAIRRALRPSTILAMIDPQERMHVSGSTEMTHAIVAMAENHGTPLSTNASSTIERGFRLRHWSLPTVCAQVKAVRELFKSIADTDAAFSDRLATMASHWVAAGEPNAMAMLALIGSTK